MSPNTDFGRFRLLQLPGRFTDVVRLS